MSNHAVVLVQKRFVRLCAILTLVSALAAQDKPQQPRTPQEACEFASAPLRNAYASGATISAQEKAYGEQEALAKKYLLAMKQQPWAGEQEFYLGKLASLAEDAAATRDAIEAYLRTAPVQHHVEALQVLCHAQLFLSQKSEAHDTALALLSADPKYTYETHFCIQQVIDATIDSSLAVDLIRKRLPAVLAGFKGDKPDWGNLDDAIGDAVALKAEGQIQEADKIISQLRAASQNIFSNEEENHKAQAAFRQYDLIGSPLPDLSAYPVISRTSDRPAMNGKRPLLLEFYAYWCPGCQDRIPMVDALRSKFLERADVLTIATTWGFWGDQANLTPEREVELLTALWKSKSSGPLLLVPKDIFRRLGYAGLPAVLLADASGTIRYISTGYGMGSEQLSARLDALISESKNRKEQPAR